MAAAAKIFYLLFSFLLSPAILAEAPNTNSTTPRTTQTFPPIPSTIAGNALSSDRVSSFTSSHASLLPFLSVNTSSFASSAGKSSTSLGAHASQFEALNLRDHLVGCPPTSRQPEVISPTLAVGIITAVRNTAHRLALRNSWLLPSSNNPLPYSHPPGTSRLRAGENAVHNFFLALPPSEDPNDFPGVVLLEACLFGDISILPFVDSYEETPKKSIALFNWGVSISSSYILRSNDDVFLSLPALLQRLSNLVPALVYGGLHIPGSTMRIPRPQHHPGHTDSRTSQKQILSQYRAWTFTTSDYPTSAVPDFAQGNAILLSADLAMAVRDLAGKEWRRTSFVADDVLIGLIVQETAKDGNVRYLNIEAGYEHEGRWVECAKGKKEGWWFNIHSEYMYMLWENAISNRDMCEGIDERMCCGVQ